MSMHKRMRNMVIRQLGTGPRGNGVPVTLQKFEPGVWDDLEGGYDDIIRADYIGSGVRVNYTEWTYKGADVEYGDFQIYLSPVQHDGVEMPTPQIDDVVIHQGEEAKVIKVHPFNDNQVGCGWKLQVRRG